MQSSVRGRAALASGQDEQANGRVRTKHEAGFGYFFGAERFRILGALSGMAPLRALEPSNSNNQLPTAPLVPEPNAT
jgi:hypothetical protein